MEKRTSDALHFQKHTFKFRMVENEKALEFDIILRNQKKADWLVTQSKK